MITRNEKAKGLWWRLLATLPVLAILMIANTKVSAQEQLSEKIDINVEMGWFEIYDDFGNPMNLTDTVIYNEDGSYVKFETNEVSDPVTGEMRNKITASCCNADGTPNENFQFHLSAMEKHGDTTMYSVDPFTLSVDQYKLKILTTEDNSAQKLEKDNDSIYNMVDQMPEFPGGMEAMMKYLSDNIKYPEGAKDKGVQGRVFIGFVVEKDGSVSGVKIMKGIGGECDEEALRVVKAMPKWKPGKKDGKNVRVSYTLPINFKLDENQTTKPGNTSDMKPDKNGVYQLVEEMPEFPGGMDAMMKYLSENIKYPKDAIEKNQAGRVFVSFVVGKDGSINEATILRGVSESLDKEALRVVNAMPKWTPGKVKGEPVKVQYNLPIVFKL